MRVLTLVLVFAFASSTALPAAGQEPTLVSKFDLEAGTSTFDKASGDFEARDNVRVFYDQNTMQADSVRGNAYTREIFANKFRAHVESLFLRGADLATHRVSIPGTPGQYGLAYVVSHGMLTTCSREHPHFKVTAQRLSVLPGQRATMRRASVWLGNSKLMTLPKVTLKLKERSSGQSIFPRPGYDSKDGISLSLEHQLSSSDRFDAVLDVRQTVHNGLQGGVRTNRLLAGQQSATRASVLTDLRMRPLSFPKTTHGDLVRPPSFENRGFSGQLMAFANYYEKLRTFDIDAKELLLDIHPQVGVRWITNPRRLWGSGISPYLAGQASWGDFREVDEGEGHQRTDARMTISTLPIPVSANVLFQPAAYFRTSSYSNGDSYGNRGISADLSTSFGRAYLSGRIVSFTVSGSTPFEFDDIDRFREFQASLIYTGRCEGLGVVLRYGLDEHSLYDWELSYTRRHHCLEPTVTWENRFGLFRLDIRILGLD